MKVRSAFLFADFVDLDDIGMLQRDRFRFDVKTCQLLGCWHEPPRRPFSATSRSESPLAGFVDDPMPPRPNSPRIW